VSAAAFAAVEAVFWSAVARATRELGFGASMDWPALAMGAAFVAVGGPDDHCRPRHFPASRRGNPGLIRRCRASHPRAGPAGSVAVRSSQAAAVRLHAAAQTAASGGKGKDQDSHGPDQHAARGSIRSALANCWAPRSAGTPRSEELRAQSECGLITRRELAYPGKAAPSADYVFLLI
jgi:hypothetical protein